MQRDGKAYGVVTGSEHADLSRNARPQLGNQRRRGLAGIDVGDVTRSSRESLRQLERTDDDEDVHAVSVAALATGK